MFFPDDPQKQALMAMALGLLSGAPGQRGKGSFGADLGQAGLLGMNAYGGAQQFKMKQQEEEQQREMRRMQMEQMKAQAAQQQRLQSLPGQFMLPGNLTPNDDEGNAMPPAPRGFDMPGYADALMGIDPVQGFQLKQAMTPKPKMAFAPNGQAVDMNALQPGDSFAPAEKPKTPEVGKLREIYQGGTIVQQEWTGDKWRDVGKGPRFKPDAPERPAAPQLYEGPNGPMWITPPSRGQQGPVPVAGPDGQPLGPKKEKALTEAQAKATLYTGMMQDAERAISGLEGFDPTKIKNQTDIVLARGDLPKIPKAMQNLVASKQAQQYAQGTFQWTEAMLRQLTGAAAPEPEVWRQVKTYWPQPGDKPEVVAQKNAARARVAELVRTVAGPGAEKADAAVAPSSAPNIEELLRKYLKR